MLLKLGAIMMISSVALAAVVAVVVSLSGPGDDPTSQAVPLEPAAAGIKEEPEKEEFDPGQKLEIERKKTPEEPAKKKPPEEPREKPEPEKKAPPAEPSAAEPSAAEPEPIETLPVEAEDWPEPSGEEIAAVEAPRYYSPRQDGVLTLTVDSIGLYDVPVINANTQQALDNGVIHIPQTPMPWEEREQKNVYLAGHRLGFPGTGSRLVFYNLDKLKKGDSILLEDSLGEPYEYRVSEVFVVEPGADWVVDPVQGRNMLTLQTCTFPDLLNRIIVRADRV